MYILAYRSTKREGPMNADETIEQLTELAAQAAEHRNRTATMTARQKILEIPPADPLRKAFEVIRKQQAEIERLKADHLQTLKQLDEQKEQLDEITARNKYLEANSELQLAQWQEDTKQMLSLVEGLFSIWLKRNHRG